MSNHDGSARSLRPQWAVAAALYTAGIAAGYFALSAWWGQPEAITWLIPASITGIFILDELWQGLPLNHPRDNNTLFPTLGVATALTLARGLLLAFLAGFIMLPRPEGGLSWAPAMLYLGAALLDYADGGVARITHHSTLLGEKLDLDLDALGIVIAPLLAAIYGQVPLVYLLVSAARYLFAGGIWLLKRQGRPVYNLNESERRRGMAGFQMGLTVAVLLPFLVPPLTSLAALLFMLPFLVGFLKDWLVVSGSIDAQSSSYKALASRSEQFFYGWLPILFRAGVGALSAYFILAEASAPSEHRVLVILMIGQVVLAVLILAGILGRLSALGLLVMTGLAYQGAPLDAPNLALAIFMILVMLFGTGFYSLWQPEESFLRYHVGAKS